MFESVACHFLEKTNTKYAKRKSKNMNYFGEKKQKTEK
jgi:hypothetical protein